MSGLERTADALLSRKAIQLSNHQRTQSRIDDTIMKIRGHVVNTKAAMNDITRLNAEMDTHATDLAAADEAGTHLADRHALQTSTTNQETEKALQFGKDFKALHDLNHGLVDRIALGIEVSKVMEEFYVQHGSYISGCGKVAKIVTALDSQRRALDACSGMAGHRNYFTSIHTTANQADDDNVSPAPDLHPIAALLRGEQGEESAMASSTIEWGEHLAFMKAKVAKANMAISDTRQAQEAAAVETARLLGLLEEAQAKREVNLARAEALKVAIAEVHDQMLAKKQAKQALAGRVLVAKEQAEAARASITTVVNANTSRRVAIENTHAAIISETSACNVASVTLKTTLESLSQKREATNTNIQAQKAANATSKNRIKAKLAASQRIKAMTSEAVQKATSIQNTTIAEEQLTKQVEANRTAQLAHLAMMEEEAARFEWALVHASRGAELQLALVGDEQSNRGLIDIDCLLNIGRLWATFKEAGQRIEIAEQEELAVAAFMAAHHEGLNGVAARLLEQEQEQKEKELARKRPREPSAPSALMAGHRALMADLANPPRPSLVTSTPSRALRSRLGDLSVEGPPATPIRGTKAVASTPGGSATAQAQALLASSTSLLLAEASKPIVPMTLATGNFTTLPSRTLGITTAPAMTPKRGTTAAVLAASNTVPRLVSRLPLPLPPQPVRECSSESGSVVSIFRSVSMPQHIYAVPKAKVPQVIANWNTIPPSPTPTDLGALNGTGGGALRSHISKGLGASYHSEESDDEVSLSRLVPSTAANAHRKINQPPAMNSLLTATMTGRGSGAKAPTPTKQVATRQEPPTAPKAKGSSPSPRRPSGRKAPEAALGKALTSAPTMVGGTTPRAQRNTESKVDATPPKTVLSPFTNITNSAAKGVSSAMKKPIIAQAGTPAKPPTPVRQRKGPTIIAPNASSADGDDFMNAFGF